LILTGSIIPGLHISSLDDDDVDDGDNELELFPMPSVKLNKLMNKISKKVKVVGINNEMGLVILVRHIFFS